MPPRRPSVAASIYGTLLLLMAGGQLSNPSGFAEILTTYDVFGGTVNVVAGVIIVAELVAGVGLLGHRILGGRRARTSGLVGLGVAIIWAGLATQAFARGLDVPNCGCFGVHLGQRLRWWVLLEDAYMLILAWYAARSAGARLPDLIPRRTRAAG